MLGLTMGGLTNAVGSVAQSYAKPRGGLFGTGITGQQIGDALGAFGGVGQQQPIQHAQFQPMPFEPMDYGQPVQRRPVQPIDLSRYLYPGGYY